MITDFDDFCTWMYMIVDDIWLQIASLFKRPSPAPTCSDSEIIAMALVGECRGWDVEPEMLSHWHDHQDLFPHIPSQSRLQPQTAKPDACLQPHPSHSLADVGCG